LADAERFREKMDVFVAHLPSSDENNIAADDLPMRDKCVAYSCKPALPNSRLASCSLREREVRFKLDMVNYYAKLGINGSRIYIISRAQSDRRHGRL
jgi:hypothetical protein